MVPLESRSDLKIPVFAVIGIFVFSILIALMGETLIPMWAKTVFAGSFFVSILLYINWVTNN